MESVKNYTKSELFTLANKIRKEMGCTQSEAYHKAKAQLENPKKSNRGRKANYSSIRIGGTFKPSKLKKFNLTVGQTFNSVPSLAKYMNVSVQQVYGYIRGGQFELI